MKKFHKGLIASLAVVTAGTVGSVIAVTANQPKVDNVNNDKPSIVEPIDTRPKVEFVTNGGSVIKTQHVDEGSTIEEPVSIRGGYKIVGWFLDQACSKPYNFNTPVTEDIKLYALWRTEFTFDIVTSSEGAACTVTGYNGTDTDITIPSKYEGLPVTAIGENAFANIGGGKSSEIVRTCNVNSVVIPNSVKSIGSGAFYNCESLTSVTIPDSVTDIGEYAFCGTGLTSVTLPNGVACIESYVFDGCYQLQSVVIPEGIASIGEYAFGNCYELSTITIPTSVLYIGKQTFGYTSLTAVVIPESVKTIGDHVYFSNAII